MAVSDVTSGAVIAVFVFGMTGSLLVPMLQTIPHLRAKDIRLLRHGDKNSWLEITLDEGKNRQIRRLLESQGIRVLRLVRVSIGPLKLGDLKKASVRQLTPEEKQAIDQMLHTRASR